MYDVLPDGRLIGMNGAGIRIETAVGSGQFSTAGTFDSGQISPYGASFLSVSPNGSRIAIGDGNFGNAYIYTVNLADLNGGAVSAQAWQHENYAATWMNDHDLAVSMADPNTFLGQVHILDFDTGVSTLLVNIDGASAGVSFDASGNLLTGNGFDYFAGSGSNTGDIRVFSAADIDAVLSGQQSPFDFANSGGFVGRFLSAGGLEFDPAGRLFVGGGDVTSPSNNYFTLFDSSDVSRAIAGIEPLMLSDAFTDDPSALPLSSYVARYDAVTGAWLVADGPSDVLYRYTLVPTPGTLEILILALGAIPCVTTPRRRRPSCSGENGGVQ